jgi:hypothetical protein
MGMSFALYPKKLGMRHVIGAALVFAAPYVAQSGAKSKAKKTAPVPLVAAAAEDGQP